MFGESVTFQHIGGLFSYARDNVTGLVTPINLVRLCALARRSFLVYLSVLILAQVFEPTLFELTPAPPYFLMVASRTQERIYTSSYVYLACVLVFDFGLELDP